MILFSKRKLTGSPHKTLIESILFDFMKKRENMNLCVSKKSVLKPFSMVVSF